MDVKVLECRNYPNYKDIFKLSIHNYVNRTKMI